MAYVLTLSGREREVLALVAEDLTNKQIAQRLRISPNTVQGYVSLALNKLGAANRREAIVLATQQRLIPQQPGRGEISAAGGRSRTLA
jgi:DNA-binding CsgD family transcriptional regulator